MGSTDPNRLYVRGSVINQSSAMGSTSIGPTLLGACGDAPNLSDWDDGSFAIAALYCERHVVMPLIEGQGWWELFVFENHIIFACESINWELNVFSEMGNKPWLMVPHCHACWCILSSRMSYNITCPRNISTRKTTSLLCIISRLMNKVRILFQTVLILKLRIRFYNNITKTFLSSLLSGLLR